MSFIVNALEADKESKDIKITCVTSHPPYTGPLEYVDIQRQEVSGELYPARERLPMLWVRSLTLNENINREMHFTRCIGLFYARQVRET